MSTMTLSELVRDVKNRHDALAPHDFTDLLPMYEARFPEDGLPFLGRLTGDRRLRLSQRAEGQLLQRCGIPAPFFHRLPSGLRWSVANWAIQNSGGERAGLFRTVRGDLVRALLTESFTPLDDVDVFPLIADVLADDAITIEALSFDDDYTHLRAVFPRNTIEVRKGDVVMAGVNVSNSETGQRAVHLDALVYRLVCTNGLVRAESQGKTTIRHIGQPARLKDAIAIAVRDAKTNAYELAVQFKKAVDHHVADPLGLLADFAKDSQMSKEQLQAALAAFAAEPDSTAYGVVNAVTRAAQAQARFEDRYQMERLGAGLLARLN